MILARGLTAIAGVPTLDPSGTDIMPQWIAAALPVLTSIVIGLISWLSNRSVRQHDESIRELKERTKGLEERTSQAELRQERHATQHEAFQQEQNRMRDSLHKVAETVQTHSAELSIMGRSRNGKP